MPHLPSPLQWAPPSRLGSPCGWEGGAWQRVLSHGLLAPPSLTASLCPAALADQLDRPDQPAGCARNQVSACGSRQAEPKRGALRGCAVSDCGAVAPSLPAPCVRSGVRHQVLPPEGNVLGCGSGRLTVVGLCEQALLPEHTCTHTWQSRRVALIRCGVPEEAVWPNEAPGCVG